MKRTYFPSSLLLAAIFLITSLSLAQQEERSSQPQLTRDHSLFPLQSTRIWTEVHPLIPRIDYWGVDFVNADTGWAVGEGGAIIKTTNGGQKWIWYESGVENTLRTIASVNNGQRVIAAGDGGIILISENAGETWNVLPSGTTDNIWNVQMVTNVIGWMVGEGGTALKTTDGGLTWTQQPMPYPNLSYWDVSFVSINIGYISCPSGVVIKTTNGGGNWVTQLAGDTRALWTIYAIDSLKVCAGGFAGKLVYTSNGGNTWIPLQDFGTSYNKITFADSLNGIGAGDGSIRTTDGGLSWYLLNIHNITDNNVAFNGSEVGYMVGNSMSLLKTSDSGVNWSRTIFNGDWHDVHFINEMKGYFINYSYGYEGLYRTDDGGANYYKVDNAPGGGELYFLDSLTGFIGGNLIYKTTDGGETWYTTQGSGGAGKINFINSEIGWAIRSNIIYKTTNGGENWFNQLTAPSGSFQSIHFVDSLYGWAAILSRRPYKTTDGGTNWIEQTNLNIWGTRDVFFKDYNIGWFANEYDNDLLKTIDGGVTWQVISGVIGPKTFSFFPDTNRWWVYGFSNLYETINGGETWNNITPPITLFSKFNGPFNWLGYGVGGIGYIIKYFDSTYVPVELILFNAELVNDGVRLIWVTATELNNRGYEIQKSYDMQNWKTIGFVEGKGNSTEYIEYSFIDAEIAGDEVFYRLKQVDFNGSFEYSQVIEVNLEKFPLNFNLKQNFPNPFNLSTVIKYSLPEKSFVNISLYDIKGEKVSELVNEQKEKGIYSIKFIGDNLATGVYLYRIVTSSGYNFSRKLILLK